jgi:acetate kinase
MAVRNVERAFRESSGISSVSSFESDSEEIETEVEKPVEEEEKAVPVETVQKSEKVDDEDEGLAGLKLFRCGNQVFVLT